MVFTLPETWSVSAHKRTARARARRGSSGVDLRVVRGLIVHPGDLGGGATPVPIPNTAVKPSSADGTVRATWWESRTLPGLFPLRHFHH